MTPPPSETRRTITCHVAAYKYGFASGTVTAKGVTVN